MSVAVSSTAASVGMGWLSRARGGRESAQGVVDELDGGGGERADGGQGLLHRGQERGWGGDGAARAAVPLLRDAALAQQDPHGPGEDGAAGQPGEQPRRGRPDSCPAAGVARLLGLGATSGAAGRSGTDAGGGASARVAPLSGRAVGPGVGGPGRGREGVGLRPGRLRGGAGAVPGAVWAWLCGDGQGPPDVDDVRVAQVRPAGLGDVAGRRRRSRGSGGRRRGARRRCRRGCRPSSPCRCPPAPRVRARGRGRAGSAPCPGRRNPGRPPRVSALRSAISR